MPSPLGVAPIYTLWVLRGDGRYSDELQAVCGIIYSVGQFVNERDPDLAILKSPPKQCFTTDDLWIAGILAVLHSVPRVLVGGSKAGMTPVNSKWKASAERENKWDLSVDNSKPGKDMACINAVEARLGRPWSRVAPSW